MARAALAPFRWFCLGVVRVFKGIHAVLYALFQADERIDPGAMKAQVAYCLETSCDGITVLDLRLRS